MKNYLTPIFLSSLFIVILPAQDIIKQSKKDILENSLKQSIEDSKLQKDSWINSATIEATLSKEKPVTIDEDVKSKKISINIEQEIFKSGAILKTISKGKNLETLSNLSYEKSKKELLFSIYTSVITLKIIDLNLQKQQLLIENKELEVNKKLDLYYNGLEDINELDESIIELSELKNLVEDLNIEKSNTIKELKTLSQKSYKEIPLDILSNITVDEYIKNNLELQVKNLKISTV